MNEVVAFGYCSRRPGETAPATIKSLMRAECERRGWTWHGLFIDAFLARSTRLESRDAGFALTCRLRQGDVVLTNECFDVFRTAADCQATLESWKMRGVTAVSLDGALDSPAALDQWARGLHRLRALEAAAVARANQQPTGQPPLGYRWVGRRGRRRLVPNVGEVAMMREAYELSAQGRSRFEVARALMLAGRRSPRTRREWSPTTARRAIDAYAELLEGGAVPTLAATA